MKADYRSDEWRSENSEKVMDECSLIPSMERFHEKKSRYIDD